jgi:phosphomannomutase/phosphoglucomutase
MANSKASLTPGIFKAYDIRGVLDKTLDTDIARQIGQSFGSAALEKNETTVVIGRDGRLSGPSLAAAHAVFCDSYSGSCQRHYGDRQP